MIAVILDKKSSCVRFSLWSSPFFSCSCTPTKYKKYIGGEVPPYCEEEEVKDR